MAEINRRKLRRTVGIADVEAHIQRQESREDPQPWMPLALAATRRRLRREHRRLAA